MLLLPARYVGRQTYPRPAPSPERRRGKRVVLGDRREALLHLGDAGLHDLVDARRELVGLLDDVLAEADHVLAQVLDVATRAVATLRSSRSKRVRAFLTSRSRRLRAVVPRRSNFAGRLSKRLRRAASSRSALARVLSDGHEARSRSRRGCPGRRASRRRGSGRRARRSRRPGWSRSSSPWRWPWRQRSVLRAAVVAVRLAAGLRAAVRLAGVRFATACGQLVLVVVVSAMLSVSSERSKDISSKWFGGTVPTEHTFVNRPRGMRLQDRTAVRRWADAPAASSGAAGVRPRADHRRVGHEVQRRVQRAVAAPGKATWPPDSRTMSCAAAASTARHFHSVAIPSTRVSATWQSEMAIEPDRADAPGDVLKPVRGRGQPARVGGLDREQLELARRSCGARAAPSIRMSLTNAPWPRVARHSSPGPGRRRSRRRRRPSSGPPQRRSTARGGSARAWRSSSRRSDRSTTSIWSEPKSTCPRSSETAVKRAPASWSCSSSSKTLSSAAASMTSVWSPPPPVSPVSMRRSRVVGCSASDLDQPARRFPASSEPIVSRTGEEMPSALILGRCLTPPS